MTIVVLLLGLVAGAVSIAWAARRHRQRVAWDHELDVAFARDERQENLKHRVL